MPRKFLYILTILLAALSLTITACETDDDEDATDGTTAAGGTATGGAAGGTAAGGTATGGATTTMYQYVRITDTSMDSGTEDAGADIDAVGVRSAATGMTQWATTVEGTAGDVPGNTANITGEPTAFANWAQDDLSTCGANAEDDGFTSLGGSGAISVGFASAFTSGDTVVVYEVGDCDFGGGTARAESITIDVAVASDVSTAMWVNIFSGTGSPLISATIP